MKRAIAIAAVVELIFVVILMHTEVQTFFWAHPWWRNLLASLPAIAVAVFAFFQWQDSGKINELHAENNRLQNEANTLRTEANKERARANEALARIAENTQRAVTPSERNAAKLLLFLRRRVQVVNVDDSAWPEPPEIVDVKDEVVTLFTPCGPNSSTAMENHVQCGDLEIVEAPVGSLPLTLKVLKRYGAARNLGEVKTWEERVFIPTAAGFPKGANVFRAEYITNGSSEVRRITVFEAADGSNLYLLEPSVGASLRGDNKEISKKAMLLQLEYRFEGFRYNGGGTGGSNHALFLTPLN